MANELTFEVAALADAVAKAARVAPSKGGAFDRAAGIQIDYAGRCLIKATNIDTTFIQDVSVISMASGVFTWRLPSALLTGILGTLPLQADVTLAEEGDSTIVITCGKTRTKLRRIVTDYPEFEPFSVAMATVQDFAHKVSQVSWTCKTGDDQSVLSGVHIDGQRLTATDGLCAATIPCAVPVADPITVPLQTLASLLKTTSEVKLAAQEKKLLLMPDDFTWATASIYAGDYPDVQLFFRNYKRQGDFTIDRATLDSMLQRMLIIARNENYPRLRLNIGDGLVQFYSNLPETGEMTDELEAAVDGPPHEVWFTTPILQNALRVFESPEVTIEYGPEDMSPARIIDKTDLEVIVMPRQKPAGI